MLRDAQSSDGAGFNKTLIFNRKFPYVVPMGTYWGG